MYYKEIVFKDESNVTYVMQPISTNKGIFVEGFDSETKKSIKKAKHSDFDKIINHLNKYLEYTRLHDPL